MRLLFKQRIFSWLDSYDITDENDNKVYEVKGQLAWGHCLKIFDIYGREVGTVKEKIFTFLPKFEIYEQGRYLGCINKECTFLKPQYNIEYKGWHIEGNWLEWDYMVTGSDGRKIASVSKEYFHLADTYVLDIVNAEDALYVLMFVLAIDAEKCSRDD